MVTEGKAEQKTSGEGRELPPHAVLGQWWDKWHQAIIFGMVLGNVFLTGLSMYLQRPRPEKQPRLAVHVECGLFLDCHRHAYVTVTNLGDLPASALSVVADGRGPIGKVIADGDARIQHPVPGDSSYWRVDWLGQQLNPNGSFNVVIVLDTLAPDADPGSPAQPSLESIFEKLEVTCANSVAKADVSWGSYRRVGPR